MNLSSPSNYGNSPKSKLVLDLTVLFSTYAIEEVMEYLAEDVVWTLVGDKPIHGKENFAAALREMSDNKVRELIIHQIIPHGKESSVSGEMVMEDGKTYSFADFYTFASSSSRQVKSIRSYVILLN